VRSWREVGYVALPGWWRQVLVGLGLGVFSYGIGGLLLSPYLHCGERPWRVAGFALTGVVVALIEETFFRGGLQNVFQRQMKPWLGVLLVSGMYSVVHFLKPSGAHIPHDAVRWNSGFEYLGGVVACSFQEPGVWRSVVTLWLVGIVLGWAFVRTRVLYLSIGLHAGWVFALKTLAWLGGGSLVDKPLLWPVLLVVLGGIEWWSRRKQKN
jgi:membrane protease YdiL (CAAX protease family)